jgi:hypothetical protein
MNDAVNTEYGKSSQNRTDGNRQDTHQNTMRKAQQSNKMYTSFWSNTTLLYKLNIQKYITYKYKLKDFKIKQSGRIDEINQGKAEVVNQAY